MYCPDTLQRLNDEQVARYRAQVTKGELVTCDRCNGEGKIQGLVSNSSLDGIYTCPLCLGDKVVYDPNKKVSCDYCDEPATYVLDALNPADEVREVEGAYGVIHLCLEHSDDYIYLEDHFYCQDCGRLFITNHSWDFLAVIIDGEYYCQKCAIEHAEPMPLYNLLRALREGRDGRLRINNIPDREKIWSGEYSDCSDFPGFTSLDAVAEAIQEAAEVKGLTLEDEVIPLTIQSYQFSLVLGIFH